MAPATLVSAVGGVRRSDQVNLKVEFEIEDDGTELEIELTW